MSYYRTVEHHRLRAELITRWKPWKKSTGPKSAAGKAKPAQNAYRAQRVWCCANSGRRYASRMRPDNASGNDCIPNSVICREPVGSLLPPPLSSCVA